MDGYKYLSQIARLRKKVTALQIRKRSFERMADSVPTHPTDEPVIQKSRDNKAPFIRWIDKIANVEQEIIDVKAELNTITTEAMTTISQIENQDYQSILIMRFIDTMTWEDISDELSIARQTCWRWYHTALNEFERCYTMLHKVT